MSGTRGKAGRLWPNVEGYRTWLTRRGYTSGTARNMLQDLGQVGLWLSAEGLETEDLSEERAAVFLSAWRAAGRKRVPGPRAMMPLMSYLREVGAIPEQAPLVTPLDALLASYRLWLLVPLHSTAMHELTAYAELRDELEPRPKEQSFFVSQTHKRLCYEVVCQTF